LHPRALVLLLLVASGCYVGVRGGPAYDLDGDRRGVAVDVVAGAEMHFSPMSGSPVDRRFAAYDSLGVTRIPAAGAHHTGIVYELGGSALVQLQRDKPTDAAGRATFVRLDASIFIGTLPGLGEGKNVGTVVGAQGLVEIERYWDGWALRAGAGIRTTSVQIAAAPDDFEGSYAPVGALTFEYTPVVARAVARAFGR
jgi:hypothetical protein